LFDAVSLVYERDPRVLTIVGPGGTGKTRFSLELARLLGDDEAAFGLRGQATALRERFNRDFWLEGDDFYALALDGDKRPCAVISSNPGHALWTGIVDDNRAASVIKRLLAHDMFSGWGSGRSRHASRGTTR
jgi:glycogen debranching enzyme